MNVEKLSEKQNPLFSRKEFVFEAESSKATPSRKDLTEAISKKTGAGADCVSIQKVDSAYGSKKCKVTAYIYPSADALAKQAPAHLAKRGPKKKAGAQ